MQIEITIRLIGSNEDLLSRLQTLLSGATIAAPGGGSQKLPKEKAKLAAKAAPPAVDDDEDDVDTIDVEAEDVPVAPKRKPGRPAKSAPLKVVADEDDEDEDAPAAEDDDEDEAPAPPAKKGKTSAKKELDFEEDFLPAIRKYTEKNGPEGRKTIKKVLDKFRAKNVQEIKAADYSTFLEQLKG